MCSIGVLFKDGTTYVYKQCDLTNKTRFYDPLIKGPGNSPYLAMTRDERPGLWAGMSFARVAFVAADAYTNRSYEVCSDAVNQLFNAYERAVAAGANAKDAAGILRKFYLSGYLRAPFPGPDIALFADPTCAVLIEYTPALCNQANIREIVVNKGSLACTNHFRVQYDAVNYESNHSTYSRLARAETILGDDPSLHGIGALLTDQYYGASELSICRVAEYPQEYFTQATVILEVASEGVGCQYQVNGNPIANPLKPFMGAGLPWKKATI